MAEREKQEREGLMVDMPDRSSPPRSPRTGSGGHGKAFISGPALPVVSYCAASIMMTLTNKYVLSGYDFNLNFFLLCVQVSFSHDVGSGARWI